MNSFRNIYNSNLSHRARSVYMYLKDRADSEGRCWPAIRTIALELGLSRSTVKRALMISAGPVCCKRTHAGGKMGVLLPICIMWYDGGVQCWLRSIYWIIWLIKWDAEFFLIFGCSSKVNGCTGSLPRSLSVHTAKGNGWTRHSI